MGRPFCEKFLIIVKCPHGSRKKCDWFRCKKISQKLKYLNFKCEQSERIFFRPVLFVSPLCACPMQNISLATSKKREWKSGFTNQMSWDHYVLIAVYIQLHDNIGPVSIFSGVPSLYRKTNDKTQVTIVRKSV